MISAGESKNFADSFYANIDFITKIDLKVRELSAKGEYQAKFYEPDMVKAYGTNTLTQDMQRVLFELRKARFEIKFDFEDQSLVVIWG